MMSKILDFGNAFLKSASTGYDTIDIKPSCLHYLTNSDIRNERQIQIDVRSIDILLRVSTGTLLLAILSNVSK